MAEYIKRAYVEQCMNDSFRNAGIPAEARRKMQKWLDNAPSADVVERKKGKWEKHHDDVVYWWQCSECQCVTFYEDALTNFCPNCGADMRGENDV